MLDPLIPHGWQIQDVENLLFWDCTGLVAVQTGGGKAQPLDSKVLTPSGFIRMGDIEVGQTVITPSGDRTRVTGVYPQGKRPTYRVTFVDGREVLADEDHLWSVHNRTDAHLSRPDRTLTTRQIAETCHAGDGSSRWFVSVISAPELGDGWKSTIDPYVLGLLLGDGGMTTAMVYYSGMDEELLNAIRAWLPEGHELRKASGDCDYRISTGRSSGKAGRNLVTNELRRLGLMGKGSGEKFIPEELKHSSVADRHALLQGLFDTDGSMKHSGGVEYSTKSPHLKNDVIWLVHSLGGKAIPKSVFVNGVEYFRIFVRLPNDFPPFRLARKANRAPVATKYALKHLPIRSVEYVGLMETQCIAVEHESHEYVTDGFIRTHNTTVAVETVLRSGHHTRGAVLVIAPKSTFKKTWVQTFERQGGITPRQINSTKAGKEAELDLRFNEPGVYLINHELFTRRDWAGVEPELAIVDECFVAGTMISTPNGEVPIESLRVGDTVFGFDHAANRVVESTVTNLMQRDSMYVDKTFGATVNHPFYVEGYGYLPLADIEDGEFGYYLDQTISGDKNVSVVRAPIRGGQHEQEQRVLLSQLCTDVEASAEAGYSGEASRGVEGLGWKRGGSRKFAEDRKGQVARPGVSGGQPQEDDGEKPVQRPGSAEENRRDQEGARSRLFAPKRRKWEDRASGESFAGRAWRAVGSFFCGSDAGEERRWVSGFIQDRHSPTGTNDRRGVRRKFSQLFSGKGTRREEGRKVAGVGLDDLAILEPRNLERYHRVRLENLGSGATRVYNIETTTSNYFANRALVHNCHKMSNYSMLTKKKTNSGAWKLTHFAAKRRIAMSATPYRNNFSNIWTLLRWLYPDQNQRGQIADRSFWRWTEEWCVVEQDYFAGKVVKGELVPGKLVSQIPCYIYHAKRQACCEFHPEGFLATDEPERIVRTVELSPAMKKAYKQLEEDYVAFLGENPLVVELPIVMRARLRQMSLGMIQVDEHDNVTYAVDCESPKYDDLKDVLEQEIPGEPVLVVTHSKQFALVLAEKLRRDKYTVAEWHGDLKQSERDDQGDLFAEGKAQILVATIDSLGTGTDFLQRVTQTIVWMSRTDDSTTNEQMEGRLDRVGSLGRVVSIEIQAEGTYDAGVMGKDLQHALDVNRTLAGATNAR